MPTRPPFPRRHPLRRVSGRLLLFASLAGIATASGAQVNTEAIRPHFDHPGWQGSFRLGLGVREGNSETVNFATGFRLQHGVPFPTTDVPEEVKDAGTEDELSGPGVFDYHSPRRVIFLSAHTDVEEQDGERAVNEGFLHARWTEMESRKWGWEAFAQIEYDEFRSLDRRWLLGGGLRFPLIEVEHHQLYLGTGLMGEAQRIDADEGVDVSDEEERILRSTSYITWRRSSADNRFAFLSTFYVQPRVDDPDDFRLLEEAEIDIAITQRLSLAIALIVRHDNEPPLPDVEKTDINLSNRLRVRF